MKTPDHLTTDLLVRWMDGELSAAEGEFVERHLAECGNCRHCLDELRNISLQVESFASVPMADSQVWRNRLREQLIARGEETVVKQTPENVMRRFGWGMAIAATLAVGIVVAPRRQTGPRQEPVTAVAAQATDFEVGGESFTPLPYSNPDLPLNSPRIVEMEVPISSLTDMGIVLEPVSNRVTAPEGSVLADVLLGADGQPLGVHVLDSE